jgi:type IV secretion system protein VirD4
MDEFASLGHMDSIATGLGTMVEFNLQIWPILQDLTQLQQHYPKSWETFISNSVVTTWLGIRDVRTSEYLTKLMGNTLVKYKSNNAIRQELQSAQIQSHESVELPFQTPHAIRNFDVIYAVVAGEKEPFGIEKLPYYDIAEFDGIASPNPLFEVEGAENESDVQQ